MAEALALAASVIAVIQITSSTISVCHNYSSDARGASWELPRLRAGLEALRNVLEKLEHLARQAESGNPTAGTQLPTLKLLCGCDGLLQSCYEVVKRLDQRLKLPDWSHRFGPKRKALVKALRWPMKEAETKKTIEILDGFRGILELALVADQTSLTLAIRELALSTNGITLKTQEDVRSVTITVLDIQEDIQSMEKTSHREAIYRWLAAPDPSTNHLRACRSRKGDTGSWFLEDERFARWKNQRSLVWLHGKAGCGKTVLSSTVIAEVLEEGHPAVAYFYFDFNDLEKQRSDRMMRSLITQLSAQSAKFLTELESLYSSCQNGERQPDVQRLGTVLKDIIERSGKTYIIIDALDECSNRHELIDILEEIQSWELPQLHMLLTSRRLVDIEEMLDPLTNAEQRICIQSTLVDVDIRTYVHETLHKDRRFRRWRDKPHVQGEIEKELMNKADGMFRWAACQLDALQECLNLRALREALKSLPRTLDDTYARILCSIPEVHSQDAVRILQWLAYAERPLQIDELSEAVAVNVVAGTENGNLGVDEDAAFPEPQEILLICPGLLIIEDGSKIINDKAEDEESASEEDKGSTSEEDEGSTSEEDEGSASEENEESVSRDDDIRPIVRFAHFSVKEYIVSERIQQNQAAAKYAIQEICAHESIAAACLKYLLQFDQHDPSILKTVQKSPLAHYAARYWTKHAGKLGKELNSVQTLGLELCLVRRKAYVNWLRLYNIEHPNERINESMELTDSKVPTPLYYMAMEGVAGMVGHLVDRGTNVNEGYGYWGNPLQVASWMGHEIVVRQLIDRGADVNIKAQSSRRFNALQAAALKGNESIVQLLLSSGADVNAQGGDSDNALQAASRQGSESIVRLLLSSGADINAQGGDSDNALQAASRQGSESIVQLLLRSGADVNAQGGHFGNALQAASWQGSESIVQLLLSTGADVNAQGGHFGNALQAAALSSKDNEIKVRLLLSSGADVNAQGGYYGNALQTASCQGSESIVQLLLCSGADVNAQGGHFGNALQAASFLGSEPIVQLLLRSGADVDAQGGYYGNALQAAAASSKDNEIKVRLLLSSGADVNAQGGKYGNALQAASFWGSETLVQLLLSSGADVNAQGEYPNAVEAALKGGHKALAKLLVEWEADAVE